VPANATINVGDTVVHPHHGVGTVTALDTVDLGAGPVPYVTISVDGGLTLKVPAATLSDHGIREPVTEKRAEEILAVLTQPAAEDPGHAVRRRRDADKLASGKLVECAEVVRDTAAVIAAHAKGGADADRNLLSNAKTQLAQELAVALGSTPEEAMARVEAQLKSRND